MQHNILSNFMTFHTTFSSQDWFKIFSYLSTLPLIPLPSQSFKHIEYACKNEVKTTFHFKEKIIKQEYELSIIKNKNIAFVTNRQKNGMVGNPEGSMALCQPDFADKIVSTKILQSQKQLVQQSEFSLQGFQWQNYLIFYTRLPNKDILLLIQEINAVVLFNKNNLQNLLHSRIQSFFYPILYHLLGPKQSIQKVQQYIKYLNTILDKHKQMVRTSPDSTMLEKIIQIDFVLVFFYGLAEAFKSHSG